MRARNSNAWTSVIDCISEILPKQTLMRMNRWDIAPQYVFTMCQCIILMSAADLMIIMMTTMIMMITLTMMSTTEFHIYFYYFIVIILAI